MYDAEGVIELLQYYDHELTLDQLLLNSKSKIPLKKGEEAEESTAEFKKRITTVSNLSEGLGHTEAGIKVLEDIDWKEERAAKIRRGIMRTLVCCEVSDSVGEGDVFFSPGFRA
jgi:hypothetical protein